MSVSAYLTAIESHLRLALGYRPEEIGEQFIPGKPPPGCGEWYVAICATRHASGMEFNYGLDEWLDVSFMCTFRTPSVPVGEEAKRLMQRQARNTFETVSRRIMCEMTNSRFTIMSAANAIISKAIGVDVDDQGGGFVEALKWSSSDVVPTECNPDWFGAVNMSHGSTVNFGFCFGLHFQGAHRPQRLFAV